ncbi:MAG TPA: hypothetical protein VGP61_02625 [Gemmatimonadales bacterium]|nr:hypothetical protein [Gemmatimonadales bacterium]
MKRAPAALLLFLLQLKPLAAAAICFREASSGTECPMPGQAPTPLPRHSGPEAPPPGCPAAAVCAAVAPALAAVTAVLSTNPLESATTSWFVPGFHSADPVAPPAPPPNA